jgi:YVTN family beta-propeller protein
MRGSFVRNSAIGVTLVLALWSIVGLQPGNAAGAVNYQLTRSFTLGGDGGWDYLTYDPVRRRLFISRASRVMVVDPATGTTSAEIPDTPGVHGIALAQEFGTGFTSNGRDNSVTVFDLASLKAITKISIAGQDPDAILYDPATKRVFTFNGRSNDATAIDPQTNTVIGTLPLPGKPEFAASGGDGTIYVNIEDKSELVAIDARQMSVLHAWPLAPCESPSGLSIDAAHQRLFAGCHNQLMAIVNAQTGSVVTTVPIGAGVDATAFDPSSGLAFSSNGDGTLTVVHEDLPDKFSVTQNVTTQQYARTMAVDPTTHNAYLVTAKIQLGAPVAGEQRPTRTIVPGTFALLVVSPA